MSKQKGNTGYKCHLCGEFMPRIYERRDGKFIPIGYSCTKDHVIRYDEDVERERYDPKALIRYTVVPVAISDRDEMDLIRAMRIQGYEREDRVYLHEQIRSWIMKQIGDYIAEGKKKALLQESEKRIAAGEPGILAVRGPMAGAASIMLEMEKETPGIVEGEIEVREGIPFLIDPIHNGKASLLDSLPCRIPGAVDPCPTCPRVQSCPFENSGELLPCYEGRSEGTGIPCDTCVKAAACPSPETKADILRGFHDG